MADETEREQSRDGFEYEGTFYPWRVTDMGKDLMLIDRFSGLPVIEFFDVVDDEHERGRGPILLTLIATSIRAGHPDWSVERISRTVMNLNLGDVEFVSADEEEEPERPPLLAPAPPPPPMLPTDGEHSRSPSNGSSLSSTPEESSRSETSSATRP